jgi:hypothetical protein
MPSIAEVAWTCTQGWAVPPLCAIAGVAAAKDKASAAVNEVDFDGLMVATFCRMFQVGSSSRNPANRH